jgi:Xaa-Pro aminopeptidase
VSSTAWTRESARVSRLVEAEAQAVRLFDTVADRGLLLPGQSERAVSGAVRDLAADLFGVSRYWHKRVVRAGPNTLAPYQENPPDRLLGADDIAFLDFGPIFEQWEADFGRTYVLGDDPHKHALNAALEPVWLAGRDAFAADPDITGERLYERVCALASDAGWEFGGHIAGHLVGQFPHEAIAGDRVHSYIKPGSDRPMRGRDGAGNVCHWILEVHLVDRAAGYGGFYEQLLDIGPNAAPVS